jgi:hypothetical protein
MEKALHLGISMVTVLNAGRALPVNNRIKIF